jgi:hypothetical protein
MSAKDFESIGVPMPRRTFLDSRQGAAGAYSGGQQVPRAPPRGGAAPHSSRPSTRGGAGHDADMAVLGSDGAIKGAADTKAVILAEHKVELTDMLQESTALLKNVYRSKFVLGETLKHVDPSYAGDSVGQFNLATPPTFDPAYSIPNPLAEEAEDEAAARAALQRGGGSGAAAGGDDASRERLRTAEELIKKLYRRNTQLEIENKYVKSEIAKLERLQGLSRTGSHNLAITDGHIPLDHPLYSKKLRRNCRSVPPQRTMLRTAVSGYGLTFPARAGTREEPQPKEDPLPVAQLKKRVLQLTEALVAVQHDNDVLQRERDERNGLREAILRKYFAERDQQITSLHALLQDLLAKVNNPMKLARAKQPALTVNPVVAHQNVIREVSQRLAEQIGALTGEIVKTSSGALPPDSPRDQSPHRRAAPADDFDASGIVGGESREAGARRKELSRRLRNVVESLPVIKRKQLLLLLTELRELYQTLVLNNQCIVQNYDTYKTRTNAETVQLKMQVALLRDQLRSLGASEDILMQIAVGGGSGGAAAGAPARDP